MSSTRWPDRLILTLIEENQALGLRALATAQGLQRETIAEILEKLRGEPDKDDDTLDWEKRAQVYRQIPELLDEPVATLDLLERLRRDTRDGHDLFFLDEAMADVGRRWKEAEREVKRRRERFFDHLPPPPAELFSRIETPIDGEVALWRDIPAGLFLMGSADSEPEYDQEKAPLGAWDDERPQHEVMISRPFQMMATPVTNAHYRAFDPSYEPQAWEGIKDDELAHHPAVNVSWYQAMAFCRWLQRGGYAGARLPTEAEREYACRAGTMTRFWSGDEESGVADVGWYTENAGDRTHRVGEKRASPAPWGLYDMHGNTWEWCLDAWDGSDYSARAKESPVEDPYEKADVWQTRSGRVFRGGSGADPAWRLRAAYRDRFGSWSRLGDLGFRVVLCRPPEP